MEPSLGFAEGAGPRQHRDLGLPASRTGDHPFLVLKPLRVRVVFGGPSSRVPGGATVMFCAQSECLTLPSFVPGPVPGVLGKGCRP